QLEVGPQAAAARHPERRTWALGEPTRGPKRGDSSPLQEGLAGERRGSPRRPSTRPCRPFFSREKNKPSPGEESGLLRALRGPRSRSRDPCLPQKLQIFSMREATLDARGTRGRNITPLGPSNSPENPLCPPRGTPSREAGPWIGDAGEGKGPLTGAKKGFGRSGNASKGGRSTLQGTRRVDSTRGRGGLGLS